MKQQQLHLFEEKFKYYEEERLKFERFKSKAQDEERKVCAVKRENEELQAIIRECKQQIEEDELKMMQLNQTVEQKERLYSHIKGQVDELSQQLEQLQRNMREREEDNQGKIGQLKKDLKAQKQERKALEAKLKEQKDLVSSRHQDSLNQSKIVQDKDLIIKKLRIDVDKAKRERDDMRKMKELQDIRQGSLEQSMMDLNALVERLQKEIDKSAQKKDKIVNENQSLAAQIVQLQAIYKEANIEDPIKFKNDIEDDKNRIQQLTAHNNELQYQIDSLKKQVQKKNDSHSIEISAPFMIDGGARIHEPASNEVQFYTRS